MFPWGLGTRLLGAERVVETVRGGVARGGGWRIEEIKIKDRT